MEGAVNERTELEAPKENKSKAPSNYQYREDEENSVVNELQNIGFAVRLSGRNRHRAIGGVSKYQSGGRPTCRRQHRERGKDLETASDTRRYL